MVDVLENYSVQNYSIIFSLNGIGFAPTTEMASCCVAFCGTIDTLEGAFKRPKKQDYSFSSFSEFAPVSSGCLLGNTLTFSSSIEVLTCTAYLLGRIPFSYFSAYA